MLTKEKQHAIKIDGQLVPVTKEVHDDYYKIGRRRRYLEKDIKVGRIYVDAENEKVTFIPNKEDSYERLIENGSSFQNQNSVEDIVCDRAMLVILHEALRVLDEEEREIIHALYGEGLTTRVTGDKIGKSHVTVGKKNKKALSKLKKYLNEKGYRNSPYSNKENNF